jgi:hypothetical protein
MTGFLNRLQEMFPPSLPGAARADFLISGENFLQG